MDLALAGQMVQSFVPPEGTTALRPLPGSQTAFLTCPIFECLYEGTRGPGKTLALIMDFGQDVGIGLGASWRGILFRQTYPQLADVIAKTKQWIPLIWPQATFNESKSTWTWPTGEELLLRHMRRRDDYWNYHGHEYPWLGFEELTSWPDDSCFRVMFACCRSTNPRVRHRVRSTTNPYGVGHNWVKRRYQLPAMRGRIIRGALNSEGEREPDRVAIHGRLEENTLLMTADPNYRSRLIAAARNPSELRAWLKGDWDIVAGGMFDDLWRPRIHVIRDFVVPRSWKLYRAFDWGSSKPFSVGWWAKSDGTTLVRADGTVLNTLRGDLIRWREWYGSTGQTNEGLRMLARDVGKGIKEREAAWGVNGKVLAGPADSSIFDEENGVNIARDMASVGVRWERADKGPGSRKQGWEALRTRFKACLVPKGEKREKPGLFVTDRCPDFINLVPVLPRDDTDLDDVDTEAEDHIGDEARYMVRWRQTVVRQGDM